MQSQNKWCFVPMCRSTSISTPNKLFITVPKDYSQKLKWFKAARRDMPKSKTTFFCCEDHFNLEADIQNYMKFQLMGGRIFLKPDAVPHRFDCQQERTTPIEDLKRSVFTKPEKKAFVEETVADSSAIHECIATPTVPEAMDQEQSALYVQPELFKTPFEEVSSAAPSTSSQPATRIHHRSVAVQARVHYRSKSTMHKGTSDVKDVASSPVKVVTFATQATSPLKKPRREEPVVFPRMSSSSDAEYSASYMPTSDAEYRDKDIAAIEKKDLQNRSLIVTRSLIEQKPKSYVGIPEKWYPFVLKLLSSKTGISADGIMLTLMKIKLNDSFSRLGDMFGMSTSNASKVFNRTLLQIAPHLGSLVYWPPEEKIKYNLPIPFRARYNKVQSIIDCLEIEIQKPSEPVKQSLTWSEYKKCNTVKYLISSTPDGFINFISKGYGGRISDSLLVQESGYLNLVPQGTSVMADRGFKDIAKLLHEKKCVLVRPPSVSSATQPTKAEVLETKSIASLRIHIERVIRRLREFEYLKPHSVIDHNLISQTDNVIKVACGLINMQTSLIR